MVVLLGVMLQGGETLWNSPHPLEAEENAPASLIPFPREVIWGRGDLEIQTPLRWGIVVNAGYLGERDSRMLNTAWRGLCTEAGNKCSKLQDRSSMFSLELAGIPELPVEGKAEGYKLVVDAKGVRITASGRSVQWHTDFAPVAGGKTFLPAVL